ncbi:hypothetical protein Q1695_003214 [Nippostrongylus brasiliensis]|nr:hypothetical protein Q1695_003214 [Nippostrongylus brasiliensis]
MRFDSLPLWNGSMRLPKDSSGVVAPSVARLVRQLVRRVRRIVRCSHDKIELTLNGCSICLSKTLCLFF